MVLADLIRQHRTRSDRPEQARTSARLSRRPASMTRHPGWMSPSVMICAESSGRSPCAPRGMDKHEVGEQTGEGRQRRAAGRLDHAPSGEPIKSSWAIAPRWVWEQLPRLERRRTSATLASVAAPGHPPRTALWSASGISPRFGVGGRHPNYPVNVSGLTQGVGGAPCPPRGQTYCSARRFYFGFATAGWPFSYRTESNREWQQFATSGDQGSDVV